MNLYYILWFDLIRKAINEKRFTNVNKTIWIWKSLIFVSIAMALNLVLLMLLFEKYVVGYYFYHLKFDFLPQRINNIFTYLILYIFPFLFLNYLLIFRKDRYKKIINKYRYYNGNLFLCYYIFSMMLPVILVLIAIIYYHF